MVGPPPPTSEPITRVGRYEVLSEIASGGMATVYLARHVGVGGFARLFAIKKLHAHMQSDEDFVAMLLDEASLAARIRHPNVVPVVDMEASPELYLVMEYIEGDKLSGLIRAMARVQRRMPPPVALRIIHDSLEGLHAAHELCDEELRPLKIIHRDISPQNILVGVDGISRISDFGIAKAESRATATRDGELKGKVGYMAPEQLGGEEIDRRVDLFAMGVTLWECLVGRRLFYRDTELESMAAVAHSVIPSLVETYGLPRELDTVVQKALARDPAKRFATARQFGDALESAAKQVGGLATTRQVADLVGDVAGEKIQRERARMREAAAFTNATPISKQIVSGIAPRIKPLEQPGPGEASVPSGVQVGRAASPSMRPGRGHARSARWIIAAAVVAVIASSLLTAVVVLRLRTRADGTAAQPARAPQATAVLPVTPAVQAPTPAAVEPVPPPVVAPAIAPAIEADAAAALGSTIVDGGEPPSAPSRRGRIRTRGQTHGEDDSDFIGINPYMR